MCLGSIYIEAESPGGGGGLIHSFSTGYPQEPSYPQDPHRVSTGSSQDIHTLLITVCITCGYRVRDSLVSVDIRCMTCPQDPSRSVSWDARTTL